MAEIPHGPCSSCPYRQDVPPGVWDPAEYDLLPRYDAETFEQPTTAFLCHYNNGNLCGGWLAAHDIEGLLAIRLGIRRGHIPVEVLDYETDVPCWGSGEQARAYGQRFEAPSDAARAAIARIEKIRKEG